MSSSCSEHTVACIDKRRIALLAGLRDENAVAEADSQLMVDALAALFPDAQEKIIQDAISSKPTRKYA
jgi:hypothetical protein